jgi:hypothetical protein
MTEHKIETYADAERVVGGAILAFSQVEAMIDGVIEMHYTPGAADHPLLFDVLADEGFSFALRCNVLRKVLERRGMLDKEAKSQLQRLRELGNTRNVFAHIGRGGIVGGKAGYLHGKKFNEVINSLDLCKIRQDFDQGVVAVQQFLLGILVTVSPYQQELRRRAAEAAEAAQQAAQETSKTGAPTNPIPEEPKS